MDYNHSFSNRTKSYLYAVNRFPHVLDEEIKNMRVEDDQLLELIKPLNYEQDRIDWKLIYFIAKKA
jgi:hypothetical protein